MQDFASSHPQVKKDIQMSYDYESSRLTFSLSCLLLLGPFHWTMVLPTSNRNTSPRLKLSQDISTWNRRHRLNSRGPGRRRPSGARAGAD